MEQEYNNITLACAALVGDVCGDDDQYNPGIANASSNVFLMYVRLLVFQGLDAWLTRNVQEQEQALKKVVTALLDSFRVLTTGNVC